MHSHKAYKETRNHPTVRGINNWNTTEEKQTHMKQTKEKLLTNEKIKNKIRIQCLEACAPKTLGLDMGKEVHTSSDAVHQQRAARTD